MVAGGVEDQVAQEFAGVGVDDADVAVEDQEQDVALGVAGVLTLFTLALSWLAVIAGLSARTVDRRHRPALPAQEPVGSDVGYALARLVGILGVADALAMSA